MIIITEITKIDKGKTIMDKVRTIITTMDLTIIIMVSLRVPTIEIDIF